MTRYVLPVLFLCAFMNAQEKKDETAATAGNIEITRSELEHRFQLNPQLNIHRKSQGEANKNLFLYGLIAEKLLSLDALDNSYDTSAAVKFYLDNFEKIFVRDELYNREIKQKSQDYASEVLSFYLENSSRIFTRCIINKDESRINDIYALLNRGVPFDTIFTELPATERDTITLYSGTLDETTERTLFILPEGSVSRPMQYNQYWVIFYVVSKNDPVIARSMGWESEYKRLGKAAGEKAETVFYKKFMEGFFPGKKAETSGVLIRSLAIRLSELSASADDSDTSGYIPGSSDYAWIRDSYPADSLNSVFVKTDGEPLYFRDFLYWLQTQTIRIKNTDYLAVAALVNEKARSFVEYELLTREGYRQNLHESENVRRMVSMWRENYLYQLRLAALSDSLLPAALSSSVSIAELYSNDLAVIGQALDEISSGEDFISAAEKYSIKKLDLSYRPVSSLGEIRDEVILSDTGTVSGPFNTPDGYVLIKLLGKKEEPSPLPGSQVVKNPFNPYISGLAQKYGVKINEEVVAGIRRSNINAVIFKYLGFGGRIAAVPIIMPVSEWVEDWRKNISVNP